MNKVANVANEKVKEANKCGVIKVRLVSRLLHTGALVTKRLAASMLHCSSCMQQENECARGMWFVSGNFIFSLTLCRH